MAADEDFGEFLYTNDLDSLAVDPPRLLYHFNGEGTKEKLHELLKKIEKYLNSAELPDEVNLHAFFMVLFKQRLKHHERDRNAFQRARRNHARLISHRPDEERVQELVAKFSENVVRQIETQEDINLDHERKTQAVKNVRRAINLLIRENLEVIGNAPIFYLGKHRKGKDIFKSTLELKRAVKKVKSQVDEGKVDKKNASVAVLMELGAITLKEIRQKNGLRKNGGQNEQNYNLENYNLKDWNDEIDRSLHWAREGAYEKMAWIRKLINRYAAENKMSGTLKPPSLNNALREDDVFDLLVKLFTEEISPRDANDIQVILNLALAHWTHHRFYGGKECLEAFKAIKSIILETLFKKTPNSGQKGEYEIVNKTGCILSLDLKTEKFQRIDSPEEQPVYVVKSMLCPREKEILMYSYQMGEKPKAASIMKNWDDDKGSMTPETLNDFYRTRFVLWNITSQQIQNDSALKMAIITMLKKVSKALKLTKEEITEPAADDDFITWKLEGVTSDGIPVEIQFAPYDTYLFENANNSGLDHDLYAERRDIKHWDKLIPPSISKDSHQALRLRGAEIDEQRKKTLHAMNQFDHSILQKAA